MNTNDNTNSKLDTQNNDEAIAEVSATEAATVAGGILPITEPAAFTTAPKAESTLWRGQDIM